MDFDGDTLVPIRSALTEEHDRPTLMDDVSKPLGLRAWFVPVSGPGIDYPYRHDEVLAGAGQKALGNIVTGIEAQVGEQGRLGFAHRDQNRKRT